jgi:hypothetical protein
VSTLFGNAMVLPSPQQVISNLVLQWRHHLLATIRMDNVTLITFVVESRRLSR